jgi:hypothetical protein
MSRHAAGWRLKYSLATVGATIIMGGILTVPVVVATVGSTHAAGASSGLTITRHENNWG